MHGFVVRIEAKCQPTGNAVIRLIREMLHNQGLRFEGVQRLLQPIMVFAGRLHEVEISS